MSTEPPHKTRRSASAPLLISCEGGYPGRGGEVFPAVRGGGHLVDDGEGLLLEKVGFRLMKELVHGHDAQPLMAVFPVSGIEEDAPRHGVVGGEDPEGFGVPAAVAAGGGHLDGDQAPIPVVGVAVGQ